MRLLTVRATAGVLGVHENTVRRWEERGILHALHLPGSGFRRFPEEEVLAVVKQMRASIDDYPSDPGEAEDRFLPATYDESLTEQD